MFNKRTLYKGGVLGALAASYLLGSVTLGGAFAQQPPPQPAPMTQQAGPGQQTQEPNYRGSIQVPANAAGTNEQAEGQALQSLARITADQARQAALAQFPNANVSGVQLENENGSLVYSVRLTDAQGQQREVKADAGNAQVLRVGSGADSGERQRAEGPETED